MGRGLSRQQRDILSTLQYCDKVYYERSYSAESIASGKYLREWRECDICGWMYYSYVLWYYNLRLDSEELDDAMTDADGHIYNPDWMTTVRSVFVQSPKVHSIQSSFRRSLYRLRDRGYVQLEKGHVKLTQLGVDFCDYRDDDD
jgi:hypothetical protein